MPTTPSVTVTRSDSGGLPTLSAIDLACRRGNRLLFKGVNFSVEAGHATWLRGRNGRGKTSLLRLATGLSIAETGAVTWGGVPVRQAPGYARQMVFVGHANALKDDLSVTESLRFLALMHGRVCTAASVHAALDRVGLASRRDALVRTLSQGQRRRATLARLGHESAPSLWILDDPYDALDLDGLESVNAMMNEHLHRGGSVLLNIHQSPAASATPMAELDLEPFA